PPVYLSHLSLYVGDDAEERKMVFGLFTHGAEESLAVLAGNIMDGENIAWKKAAHKLKGSAANFGALPLSYICKEAEENFESTAEIKQALFLELTRSYKEVSSFLGNL
ncbi:MAG: Hpt domain-containing protein, partial [Alphaproteobacteria bacterium]|nr:Hpt domain-containing protein [Alphaproteobacteria bacterium]